MAVSNNSSGFRISAIPVVILAQLLGVASLILMLVWFIYFRDGISVNTDNVQRDFNAHPFFMLFGLIYVGAQGIMAYKTVPGSKKIQKPVHSSLHLLALGFCGLGLYAAFNFHNKLKLPDMYSMHSWFGLGTIGLYTLQWLMAFFAFWFPKATSTRTRSTLVPWHAFLGIVIFVMAIISAETGITARSIHLGLLQGSESLLVNFTGVAVFLFGVATILTAILPRPY